jgi:hypothetical protein
MTSRVSFLFRDAFKLAISKRRSLILMIGVTLGITAIAGLGSYMEKSYVTQGDVQVRVAKPNEFVAPCPSSWHDHPEQAKAAVSNIGPCKIDFYSEFSVDDDPAFYDEHNTRVSYKVETTPRCYSLQNSDQSRFLGRYNLVGDISGFVPTTAFLDVAYPGKPYRSCLGLQVSLDLDPEKNHTIVKGAISGYFEIISDPPSAFPSKTYTTNWYLARTPYVLHVPLPAGWVAEDHTFYPAVQYQFSHALSKAEFQILRDDTLSKAHGSSFNEYFSYESDFQGPQAFLNLYMPMLRWFLALLLIFAACVFPLVSGLILWDERKDIKARYGMGASQGSQLALMTLQGGCLILPCWITGASLVAVFAVISSAVWQAWCAEAFWAPLWTMLGVLAGEMLLWFLASFFVLTPSFTNLSKR